MVTEGMSELAETEKFILVLFLKEKYILKSGLVPEARDRLPVTLLCPLVLHLKNFERASWGQSMYSFSVLEGTCNSIL